MYPSPSALRRAAPPDCLTRGARNDGGLPLGLLAFGDNGSGDPCCLVLEGADAGAEYEWSPIDSDAVATWPDLTSFWSDWLNR
jgi:hypothetical protein